MVLALSVSVHPICTRYPATSATRRSTIVRMNFDEEFKALLKKHGVEFDPKYVLG